jgi:gamma-D-glutamyl-L-lysine dipeptidyl-peptidase
MDKFNAVITHNVVSLFTKPDPDSDPETQCILGESVQILETQQNWTLVNSKYNSVGWVRNHTIREYEKGESRYADIEDKVIVSALFTDILTEPDNNSDIITKTTYGVELEVFGEKNGYAQVKLPNNGIGYVCLDDVVRNKPDYSPDFIIHRAKKFIGVPYLWGGKSPFGIDCSGFVQLVHESCGINLPRNSYIQAESALTVPVEKDKIKIGDLIFFSKNGNKVTHVAIAIDADEFIHSCGSHGVTITKFEEPYYANTFWSARRIL